MSRRMSEIAVALPDPIRKALVLVGAKLDLSRRPFSDERKCDQLNPVWTCNCT